MALLSQFMYYWYAARQAIDNERYPEAYTLLQFCHELKPDDAQTLYYLGMMEMALYHKEQADEYFKLAYEADPQGQWEHYLPRMFEVYLDKEQFKKAIAVLDEIEQRSGEYSASSAISRYRVYAKWNKPKQALEAIDRYLQTDPTNLRFQLFRLELLEHTKAKRKELYAQYERVLELDPYNAVVLNNYAYHLATHGGDLNKAEKMSSLAIREQPNNPVFLDTYGWILHLKGQDELAKFYLQKALRNVEPEHSKEIQSHINSIK